MPTAIVTGATKGIGDSTARVLSRDGFWVLAVGRDEAAGAELERDLQAGAGGRFITADLLDDDVATRIVGTMVEEQGRLDLLVNNAGINEPATVENTTAELFDRTIGVNLRAATLLAAAAVPAMRNSGGGTVVNVSSEAGILAFPGLAPYNISKAGMVMLTRAIVADHSVDGIRAVTVCPGTTSTPMVEALIDNAPDPAAMKAGLEDRPAARLADPMEIAEAIAFVASDRSKYLTGSELVIDGGRTVVG